MATASGEQDEQEYSVTDNSDEVKEMFCELCEKMRNTIVTAEGYCKECYEYMCAVCILYHNKSVKGHSIQGTENMQQEFCVDKCTAHVQEIVKFYCNTCDKIACTECKTTYHNGCSDISFIPELVQSASFASLLERSELKIECLKVSIETTETNINANMKDDSEKIFEQIEQGKRKTEEEIKKHTQELINQINRKKEAKLKCLEETKEQTYTAVSRELKQRQEKLQNLSTTIKSKKSELHTIQQKIDKPKVNQKCKYFVSLKNADKVVAMLTDANIRAANENKVTPLDFSLSDEKINVNAESNYITIGSLTKKNYNKRSLSYLRDISIKTLEGQKTEITVLCKVSDSRLIAADRENNLLLLIDTTHFKLLSAASLRSAPSGIAKVTDNRVIVSNDSALIFVNVTKEDVLVIVKEISIKALIGDIAFKYPNIFLLTCEHNSVCICVLDIDGKLERRCCLRITIKEKPSMLLSLDGNSIYINGSDYVRYVDIKEIFLQSQEEYTGGRIKELQKYTIKNLYAESQKKYTRGRIEGLTSDRSGTLFVAAFEIFNQKYSYMIYQWSSDLTVLYEHNLNLERFFDDTSRTYSSFAPCYYDREDKLYIGVRDKIFVYQVS